MHRPTVVATFFVVGLVTLSVSGEGDSTLVKINALCDQSVLNYRLLTPRENNGPAANEQQKNCLCSMVHQAPWGDPKIQIDCTAQELKIEQIAAETLPFGTQVLDVSWNLLERVPRFTQNVDQMQIFRLHNNQIKNIGADDFAGLTFVQELDVSSNEIQTVEPGAFRDLKALKRLNLAQNKIRILPENIFRPLKSIVHLSLNGNDLNELLVEKNLYYNLDLNAESLQVLELEYCGLTWLSIESGVGLREIRLRGNSFFKQLPLLPPNLKLLDLSANPLRRLDTGYDGQLKDMEILLLEDMPNFYIIEASALATFQSLRKISMQGSRNFTYFNELAFDGGNSLHQESPVFEHLNVIILTGTRVSRLSSLLYEYLPNVEVIALDGCPVVCDCDLKWLLGKRAGIMTNGICDKPLSVRNKLVDELQPEQMKNCSDFSRFMFRIMNALLIILMIVLCCVAMYFLVMGCRPSKKFYIRQRMGINSPYSRITVEPIGQAYRPSTISQA